MAILFHVIIALVSIVFSGFVMFSPSRKKINFSFLFIAATFITGTFLIVTMPAHMIQSCFEGLLYLGVVTIMTVFAYKKLATQENQ